MKFALLILGIFGIFERLSSNTLNQKSKETQKFTLMSNGKNESGDYGEIEIPEISPNELAEIKRLAKNISHAKGIFRHGSEELRRSIIRHVAIASESDHMLKILLEFDSAKNKIELLEQLELLVHQYDVAIIFASKGGLETISHYLLSVENKMVMTVAKVLGAAMQGNPTVQKIARNQGIGKRLILLLPHTSSSALPRIIFALSCYLRNAPNSQLEFILENGVSKLSDILKSSDDITNIKFKIIDLISDLAVEQVALLLTTKNYEVVNDWPLKAIILMYFTVEIQKYEICQDIVFFLTYEDFDTHQRIIAAMLALDDMCHYEFKAGAIRYGFQRLLYRYNNVNQFTKMIPNYHNIDPDLQIDLYNNMLLLNSMYDFKIFNVSRNY